MALVKCWALARAVYRLALASLTEDGEVLEQARRVAQEIVSVDPDLAQHPGLAKVLHDQRHRVAQAARLN